MRKEWRKGIDMMHATVQDTPIGTAQGKRTMGNMATTDTGKRIIAALEQIANDPRETPAKRAKAARDLAKWRAAA